MNFDKEGLNVKKTPVFRPLAKRRSKKTNSNLNHKLAKKTGVTSSNLKRMWAIVRPIFEDKKLKSIEKIQTNWKKFKRRVFFLVKNVSKAILWPQPI